MPSSGVWRRVDEDGGDTILRNVGSIHYITRRHTPEDGILHSHRRENLKSYNIRGCFTLNIRP
jgi:hypothetical protein